MSLRPRRSMRLRAASALGVLIGVGSLVVTPATAAPACGPGGTVEDAGGGWLASQPTFRTGPAPVTLVAAPAFDPNLLFATNGTLVVRSLDAGCSWAQVLDASEGALPAAEVRVSSLFAPSSANSSTFLYVGITSRIAGVDVPSVRVSADRGQTWTGVGDGLPPVGAVRQVTANASTPQTGYAVIGIDVQSQVATGAVYATADAGATWVRRTGQGDGFAGSSLVADPSRQTSLLALDSGRPVVSVDGGATFDRTAGQPAGPLRQLSLAPGGGGGRLAGGRSDANEVARSDDAGGTWTRLASPIEPASVAAAPLQEMVVVSDGDRLVLSDPAGGFRDVGPPAGGSPQQLSVSAPTSTGYTLTGVRAGAVLRVTHDPTGRVVQPTRTLQGALRPISLLPPGVIRQFPSTLLPGRTVVSLPAGATRRVPYRLLVPRTPSPVDLMFLIDTTGSMQPVIDNLRQNIARMVNVLGTAGLNPQFGLGDYRDYPQPYGTASRDDWPYRLDRRVGPVNDEFRRALETLQASGGTTDGGASPLTALMQSTTGSGDRLEDVVFVRPGQQARYRESALRLAMVAADTEPHYGGQSISNGSGTIRNPGPGYAEVIAALRRHRVHQVGLGIAESAMPALRRLAEGSRTFAPEGGVDCDGNGTIDVGGGKPMACFIGGGGGVSVTVGGGGGGVSGGQPAQETGAGVSGAVVALATGIPDVKPVRLSLVNGAGRARLTSPPVRRVDLRTDNELEYDVQLTCPLGPASRRTMTLTASLETGPLASSGLELSCGGLAAAAAVVVPPVRAIVEAAPPPPAPQPVANPNPNPNPNANPNPNPNPNPNANAGVVEQTEQNGQLALVSDVGEQPGSGDVLAMSAPSPSPAAEATFVAVACLLFVAAASRAYGRVTDPALCAEYD